MPVDKFPALKAEIILPNGVDLLTTINKNIVTCFKIDTPTSMNFPSIWRLAKNVTQEKEPIIIFHSKQK